MSACLTMIYSTSSRVTLVPAYWLALERMPLSPNGKLDRVAIAAGWTPQVTA